MTQFIVEQSTSARAAPYKRSIIGRSTCCQGCHQSLVTGWVSRSEHNANGRVLRRILCYTIHVGWACMSSSNLGSLCRFPPPRRVPAGIGPYLVGPSLETCATPQSPTKPLRDMCTCLRFLLMFALEKAPRNGTRPSISSAWES